MSNTIDRRTVSFEAAEGLETVPSQLDKATLPPGLRARMWSVIYEFLRSRCSSHDSWGPMLPRQLGVEINNIIIDRFGIPIDELNFYLSTAVKYFKSHFMDGEYHHFYGLLQEIMRIPSAPAQLHEFVAIVLENAHAPYRLDYETKPVTLFPFGSDQEAAAYRLAIQVASDTGYTGAVSHLEKSAQSLIDGDFPDAISNSIHAVESVCKAIAGTEKGTLKDALKNLQSCGVQIHGALFQGFEKLYGYASDEKGIRHALVFKGAADADEIDALYMLGACASFVTYIINKSRLVGLAGSGSE